MFVAVLTSLYQEYVGLLVDTVQLNNVSRLQH